jgi:tRNA(Arg) A34 adenosine deaminase TadA
MRGAARIAGSGGHPGEEIEMAFTPDELTFIARHHAFENRLGAIAMVEDAADGEILYADERNFDIDKWSGSATAVEESKRTGNPPFSPVVNLIQGLYAARGESATRLLKTRPIRANYLLHNMCRGMIEIVGATGNGTPYWQHPGSTIKPTFGSPETQANLLARIKRVQRIENHRLDRLKQFAVTSLGPKPANINLTNTDAAGVARIYMLAALSLASRRMDPRQSKVAPAGKNIAAMLVAADGEVLGAALNSVDEHGDVTCHAEVNLVQSFFLLNQEKRIPAGARIFTTLKPCAMCAGMIREAAEDNSKNLTYYGQFDPGSGAAKTALSEAHAERPLNIQGAVHVPEELWKWLPYPMSDVLQRLKTCSNEIERAQVLGRYKDFKGVTIGGKDFNAYIDDLYLKDRNDTAAAWVSSPAGKKQLEEANDVLIRKFARYREGVGRNAAVRSVLDHVVPLLQARGVMVEVGERI